MTVEVPGTPDGQGAPDPQEMILGEPEDDEIWYLRLYVAGESPKSLRAFANLKRLCENHLEHPYEIEIIDLVENPGQARGDEILAVPTLVRRLPAPMRKILGDLSDTDRVLLGLQVQSGGV